MKYIKLITLLLLIGCEFPNVQHKSVKYVVTASGLDYCTDAIHNYCGLNLTKCDSGNEYHCATNIILIEDKAK